MRALVIDDSRAMRSILTQILKKLGFEVSQAENGKEGLLRAEEMVRPDLILVDWNMPVMTGIEFLRAFRKKARAEGTPIVMVTTETETTRVMEAMAAGATEYIMKPFTADVIHDKLAMLGLVPA